MTQATEATLTITDANTPTAEYFWRGIRLDHVLTCAILVRESHQRVALRVVAPANVTPPLSPEDSAALDLLYTEMEAAPNMFVRRV